MRHGQTDDEDDAEPPGAPPLPARERDNQMSVSPNVATASRSGTRTGREHAAHKVRAVGELRSESGDNARDTTAA